MPFGRETALRAAAGIFAIGFAWAAIGFFMLGLYESMTHAWGAPGAAFITAGACVFSAGTVLMVALRRSPVPVAVRAVQHAPELEQHSNLILGLRELSQDHPLIAVLAAAVLGAVRADDTSKPC